ncbi:hypothetical protein DICPUDRAFT_78221 [Dictyostelium purpureum]|uniref:F-actin binding domain-containing protein n=1 Tax=Dictyostelium purpureum TaxID=5786 RepID=F0ZIX6_DICPU|nr:uncharacterized protein DICPUDRAFT_78221 [Dictyostelium purpureum]EGC36102.1 hypothetical protein DICPUDRAFT_78221 [Dictyostelium purpureum]|eukprot:XP_003287359.1 hypothetical protein DICPUDRAFT_78221 [Dictyostelium purpureum]
MKEIEELSKKYIEDLKYVIETNIINQDYDEDDEEDDESNDFDPLEYKFKSLKTPKEKFIELLQKVTKSCVALSKSIQNKERSNMIYATRDMATYFGQINDEATQISRQLPEGKAKEKLLESTSRCKTSSVQLKINISVKASSEEGDDVTDLNKKIVGLYELIQQCFNAITHSDRVFNDMDFNNSGVVWN